MRYIILFITICFCNYSPAQLQIPDLVIPITTTFDNPPYPPPYVGDFFEIGLDSTATDSLDNHLGEYGLPPIPPPGYPSLLFLPYNNFSGEIMDYKDFRYGELPYTGVKEHRIWFCSECGTTISWNLPPGATGLLQDLFGGVLISIPMVGQDSFYVQYTFIWELAIIINYNNVIPVEITSFKASVLQNEKSVQFNWTTATETNNSGFEILCKTQNDNEWITIGFVPGSGTTTEPKSYSFIDEYVTTGTYKYRLKQIDFDGTFSYSNEIEVVVDFTPKKFVLYQNCPNPFNPSTKIKYSIPQSSNVAIKVFDILGNEIETLVNEQKPTGTYEITWYAEQLPSGVYFYKLQSADFAEIKKMVLMK